MNLLKCLTGAAIITAAVSCGTARNAASDSGQVTYANDVNSFATNIFAQACNSDTSENLCLSPTSAAWALGITANGAEGNTLQQIIDVLGIKDGDKEAISTLQKILIDTLQEKDNNTEISIANSVWIEESLPVKKSFIAANETNYDATVTRAPFNSETLQDINSWCSQKTNGKIKSIVDNLNSDTKMLLLNALYLKSTWDKPFYKIATYSTLFTKENGDTMRVNMMHQRLKTRYFENDKFQMAAKPLGNGKLEMIFILPQKGYNITQTAELLAKGYTGYKEQMTNNEIILELPKFKAEYRTGLKDRLQAMGLTDAFTDKADFGAISRKPLWIDDIIQKTFIAVDESGVEAAAATAVMMVGMSMIRPEQPIKMTMDRPFIYIIAERKTGAGNILFMGKAGAPKE